MRLSGVLVCLALGGCSATAEGPAITQRPDALERFTSVENSHKNAEDLGYLRQAELLSDGEVTQDDQDAAFDAYSVCLEEVGFDVNTPARNPVDGVSILVTFEARNPNDPTLAAKQHECQRSEFDLVDQAFRATRPQVMDRPLLVEVLACLDRQDVAADAQASNVPDLLPDGTEDRERLTAVTGCVEEAALKIYPDLPGVSIGF